MTPPPADLPDINDPATFAARGQAWIAWEKIFYAELSVIIGTTIPVGAISGTTAAFTGEIASSVGMVSKRNGHNTFALGPYFNLSNAAGTSGILQQLNADLGIDWWRNSDATKLMTLTTAGALALIGQVSSLDSVIIKKNGSDAFGSGPYFGLFNGAASTGILQQLNAANGLDWRSGATAAVLMRLGIDGVLTLTSYGGGVVTVGAADSGGAGYKVLRVAN